jgi:hypothetical protein
MLRSGQAPGRSGVSRSRGEMEVLVSRVGRLLAAATLVGGMFVSVSPAMAARPGTFDFNACWDGTAVALSLSWSGVRVSNYEFGFGQDNGQGLAAFTPVQPPASSGSATADSGFTANIDDTVDLVGGGIYGNSLRRAILSATIHRPGATWADLPAC